MLLPQVTLTVVSSSRAGGDPNWNHIPITWQLLHYEGAPVSNPDAAVIVQPRDLELNRELRRALLVCLQLPLANMHLLTQVPLARLPCLQRPAAASLP